ncbi:PREDICTED: nuclear receptor subfamily 2 group E member 1-like [Nicrophorus vespilloides]|uniref:Nuclear receptor subfamily 2 group E member 1-like n=1 Tax=Nicrophorus vespilloides TaxID=110193 RepID=A0ABM1MSZ0_NICVS|nr:PREDICTED: nuclear receptor subfamily 2 group E member 1-like [Nicrophorus vespilloides]
MLRKTGMEESTIKGDLLCKVCGDKASGKHYGVSSCDGCRGFFKRSIRRNLEYVCKENSRCIVDVTRRNQCQACRFRKCLQVNMKRDAVQHERAPRTTIQASMHHYPLSFGPRLKTLQSSSFFSGLPLHLQTPPIIDPAALTSVSSLHSSYIQQGLIYPTMLSPFTKPGLFANNLTGIHSSFAHNNKPVFSSPSNLSPRTQGVAVKDDEVSSSEESTANRLEACLDSSNQEAKYPSSKRLELPILSDPSRRPLDVPYLTIFPTENIYESAAKLLFLSIKWARSIPSFLQLSYRDQSILLEESWSELFILTAAQWTLPFDENLLITNAITSNCKQSVLEEDARKLRDVINRLTLLRVDHTEHACLKALVLFKAECRGLCEPSHIELLQDQTHVMLSEYCNQRQTTPKGRFGKLLLALPSVQAISRKSLEELLFKQTVGDVAIDRLLGDLAKATQT